MKPKLALITGANRGMGLATSEKLALMGYQLIMVGRNENEINRESERLGSHYMVDSFVSDVSKTQATDHLIDYVYQKYGYLDVLINNAGIYIEEGDIFSAQDDVMQSTFEINTMGPYRLMKGLIPLMLKHGYGRIVNVSSGLGSFHRASSNCPAYCVSKSSLNMLTTLFAQKVEKTDVKVNSVCPGWVRTDMGGATAPRSIQEGIAGIIWAATLEKDGPNGGFFRDSRRIDW